ncbi:hypothetical protein J437_LFUL007330 [Ladona fulva]|uniref:DDE Tnp4 domain-containing protein n=1 Tax=Ladona fulva TaxID=123851 RepID=A0A8K0P5U2_LADFU|nr:hypothetical protein J437_LFUL007330 [Ladona fulva]
MNEFLGLALLRRRERERERLLRIQLNRKRLRRIRDESDPFAVSDETFKSLYRLSIEMARGLVEELRPHMVEARRSTSIPVEIKVCDSEMIILNCFGRFGGSNHDSYIWNESKVKEVLMDVWTGGEQCWLLGDSGYPHQPWLQTPILHAPVGSPEANYTTLHVLARSVVERCIGLLKARFRCLLRHRVLEYSPLKAGRIVNACVVLHNMCLKGGLKDSNVLPEEPAEVNVPPEQLPGEQMPRMAVLQEARAVRRRIINRLHL